MKVLLLIIFIILIIFLFNNKLFNNKIEGYDEKIKETTFENCLRFCKTTAQCAGFDYDNEKNICYPSLESIRKPSKDKLYSNDFKNNFPRCNKLMVINTPLKENSRIIKRPNATYACRNLNNLNQKDIENLNEEEKEHINKDNIVYIFHNRDYYNILTGTIPNYDNYEVISYEWKNKFDFDNFNEEPKHWNELLKIYKINDNEKPSIKEKNKTKINGYELHDDYNQGDFLYDNQCFSNVELKKCINQCNNNKNCKGFEYNYSYVDKNNNIKNNLCCPIKVVGKYINRPHKFDKGKFFEKKILNINNENNIISY